MTFFLFQSRGAPFGVSRTGQKNFHPPPKVGQSEKSWEFVLSYTLVQNLTFSSHLRTPTGPRYAHPIPVFSQKSLYRRL